jgi:uncharacterized protein (TIGR02217 family)
MAFINEVMPTYFSQGSAFGRSFDTRIVNLENLAEYRLARNPLGRRRYTVNLNLWEREQLYELYNFYIAVARGSLNSFLFKDWFDYASTPDGVAGEGATYTTTAFDQNCEDRTNNRWLIRKAYTYGSQTVQQHVPHVITSTVKCAINGVQYGPGTYWTVNPIEGTIDVTLPPAVVVITSVQCGYEHYVRVRFEKDVDNLFQVALHGTDVGELPSVSLIEDVTNFDWSQDAPMGGGIHKDLVDYSRPTLNQLYGRVWHCTPLEAGCGVVLPSVVSAVAKAGGPHFVVFNASASFTMGIYDEEAVLHATIPTQSCATLWLAPNASGALEWIVS